MGAPLVRRWGLFQVRQYGSGVNSVHAHITRQLLMHLLRCLTFYSAYFRFTMKATHIPGTLNTAADAISHNNIPLFLSLVRHTQQFAIPQPLVDLLVTRRPDWGSQAWTHLFVNSLSRDLPQQPVQSTAPAGADIQSSAVSSMWHHCQLPMNPKQPLRHI